MSLRITRTGILDTVQDTGRFGFQHLGINPGGAMDRFSAQLANALLGKELHDAVMEIHFPAAEILFESPTVITICGADFSPAINNQPVPLHHPIAVNTNAVLQFRHVEQGARCYISVLHGLDVELWLGSYSTNLKAETGGWKGRILKRYDQLPFKKNYDVSALLGDKEVHVLPWKANDTVDTRNEIECILGSEWSWLTREAQQAFQNNWFLVSSNADRMGYRMSGAALEVNRADQLVSSAAGFGTIQLLPDGQMIILMADHGTTGGYPRIAHIISAHLPLLAQKKPNNSIRFKITPLEAAEKKLVVQKKYLQQLQIACKFKMNF